MDFAQKSPKVEHFMGGVEGQSEVNRLGQTKGIGFATVRCDAVCYSGLFRPFLEHVQHLLLEIDGNHPAAIANGLRWTHLSRPRITDS